VQVRNDTLADMMKRMETATRLARTADLDRAAEVLGDAFAIASDHERRRAR
jgi:hypothetical protein